MTENVQIPLDEVLDKALKFLKEGKIERAERIYRGVLDQRPNCAEAWHWLGVIAIQMNAIDDALQFIESAITLYPAYAEAHANLGNAYRFAGQPEKAIDSLRRAVDLQRIFPEAHFNLGQALKGLGRLEEAEESFAAAARQRPAYVEAQYALGQVHQARGNVMRAKMAFKNCLTFDPDDRTGARIALAALGATPAPERPPQAYVAKLFDGYAGDFDRHLLETLQYQVPSLMAARVMPLLPEPKMPDILDLGCGTGLCAVAFNPHFRQLDGVDLSSEMLDRAEARGLYTSLNQADIIEYLQTTPNRYGLILAGDVLNYLGDLAPVFAGAARVLASGGLLAFTVEAKVDDGAAYDVSEHLRYRHGEAYIRRQLAAAWLRVRHCGPEILRQQADQPVTGLLVIADKG